MADCFYAVYPLIGLAINVASHILSFRYIFRPNLLKSVFFGFFCGIASVVFLSRQMSHFIINLIIYLGLSNGYFHFVNMGETSRRIRILREIAFYKDGLTFDELLKRYNAEEIIDRRLNRLIKTGQITARDERYYINKPLVLVIAKFITGLKLLVLGRENVD